MPPLKPIVFIVTFLGIFSVLTMTMPLALLETSPEYREPTVQEYFDAIDIQEFAETWDYQMNETGGDTVGVWYEVKAVGSGSPATFGGHDIDFWYIRANQSDLRLFMLHWYSWLIFPTNHKMTWKNSNGIDRGEYLYATEIEEDWSNVTQAEYTVECSHFKMKAFFGYNSTLYDNVTHAWNFHGLYVYLGIDFDDFATGMNAWNVIGMILFWQLPDVHPVLNILISIPFWACFVWIIATVVIAFIKALPFT